MRANSERPAIYAPRLQYDAPPAREQRRSRNNNCSVPFNGSTQSDGYPAANQLYRVDTHTGRQRRAQGPAVADVEPALVQRTFDFVAFEIAVAETGRSEEHTSELQSLMSISYAVFYLKKKNYNDIS